MDIKEVKEVINNRINEAIDKKSVWKEVIEDEKDIMDKGLNDYDKTIRYLKISKNVLYLLNLVLLLMMFARIYFPFSFMIISMVLLGVVIIFYVIAVEDYSNYTSRYKIRSMQADQLEEAIVSIGGVIDSRIEFSVSFDTAKVIMIESYIGVDNKLYKVRHEINKNGVNIENIKLD